MKKKESLNRYLLWKPSKIVILISLFLPIFIFGIALKFTPNNDFWFLINTGKYILNNGFPHIEPFTIHEGLSLVVQQWLTDVIFYLIYNKFGIYGMYTFILIAKLIITYLIYKTCLLISDNKIKLSILITLIINMLLSIYFFIDTRPYIFDIIIFLTEFYILESYIKSSNNKYLIILPVLSLLLINLHCSMWFMLYIFLLPYYIEYIIRKDYKIKPIIITTIIMIIVGFINPYGIYAITYIFNSYGNTYINNQVAEMLPFTINESTLVYIYLLFILITYRKKEKINIRYFLLFLGTAYLCLKHMRALIFLIIISLLPLCDNLKRLFPKETITYKKNKKDTTTYIILLLILIITFIFNIRVEKEDQIALYRISNYLDEKANKNIKLYTEYATGSYLEYRGYKCYIDPRAEVFLKKNNKKEDIFIEFFYLQNLYGDQKIIREFLQKYDFDYLLVESSDVLYYFLEDNEDYTLVYTDSYVKKYNIKETITTKYKLYKKAKEQS